MRSGSDRNKPNHSSSNEVNNQQPSLLQFSLFSSNSSSIPPSIPPPKSSPIPPPNSPSARRTMSPVQASSPLIQPTIPLSIVTFKKSDLLTYMKRFPSVPRPETANSSQLYVNKPIPITDPSRIIIERKKVNVHNKPVGALISPTTNDVVCYLIPTDNNELNAPHAFMCADNRMNSNSYLYSYNLPIKQ